MKNTLEQIIKAKQYEKQELVSNEQIPSTKVETDKK